MSENQQATKKTANGTAWIICGALGIALALSGCAASAPKPSATPKPTISAIGSVTVPIDSGDILKGKITNAEGADCIPSPKFNDVRDGSQVVVTDAGGKVVATGKLASGTLAAGPTRTAFDATCQFSFDIDAVPAGSKFYGIHVGNEQRAVQQVAAGDMDEPITMSITN